MATKTANSFSLDMFKNGKRAINGLGQEVRFVCETRGQMLVQVMQRYGDPVPMKLNLDGKKYAGTDTKFDLVEMKKAA